MLRCTNYADVGRDRLTCHIFWQLDCLNQRNIKSTLIVQRHPASIVTSYSTPPIIPGFPSPAHFNLLDSHFNGSSLRSAMPSTFSLGTFTAMLSSILMSLSSPLQSGPPPYNHAQSSYHDHPLRKNRPSQDLLIPVTPSVLIHIPSPTSYNPRSARRRMRKAQSIPMVEIVHQAVRQPTVSQ